MKFDSGRALFYFGDVSPALAPFIGTAAVTIGENKTIIKNVVEVAIAIDNHRRVWSKRSSAPAHYLEH